MNKFKKYRPPEYFIWYTMIARCDNPNNSSYHKYGQLGIAVCERWKVSFENFLSDMGHRPGVGYQIDRVNPAGNYEPTNCRWIESNKNLRNRRKFKKNKSGFKGVSWSKQRNKWRAAIAVDKKDYVIGYFDSPEEAAVAYDLKALELHQETAYLNNPFLNDFNNWLSEYCYKLKITPKSITLEFENYKKIIQYLKTPYMFYCDKKILLLADTKVE